MEYIIVTVKRCRSGRNRKRCVVLEPVAFIQLLRTTHLDVRFSMNFSTVISSSKTKSPIPGSSRVAILMDGRFVFGQYFRVLDDYRKFEILRRKCRGHIISHEISDGRTDGDESYRQRIGDANDGIKKKR